MEKAIKIDWIAQFKQLQLHQLQSILRTYKRTQAEFLMETEAANLADAIADLESQVRELETEVQTLNV
jgi:hypothetical protein